MKLLSILPGGGRRCAVDRVLNLFFPPIRLIEFFFPSGNVKIFTCLRLDVDANFVDIPWTGTDMYPGTILVPRSPTELIVERSVDRIFRPNHLDVRLDNISSSLWTFVNYTTF